MNIGALAEHRRRDYFAARTQREAGIEFQCWSEKLSPIRPWGHDLATAIGLIAVVALATFLLAMVR